MLNAGKYLPVKEERLMRKKIMMSALICFGILIIALGFAPNLTVKAAYTTSSNWISPVARDFSDSFLGYVDEAYIENTNASLAVYIPNSGSEQLNISAVKVGFDWATNYSSTNPTISTTNALILSPGQSCVVLITFTVPSVSIASNYVTHSYSVYVDTMNQSSGGTVTTTTIDTESDFAVFSANQATAYKDNRTISAYTDLTQLGFLPLIDGNARNYEEQADNNRALGDEAYATGDFADAANYYSTALSDYKAAYGTESSFWSTAENTIFYLAQGYGTIMFIEAVAVILFGIGLLLVGIGVFFYLYRKSKPQQQLPLPPQESTTK